MDDKRIESELRIAALQSGILAGQELFAAEGVKFLLSELAELRREREEALSLASSAVSNLERAIEQRDKVSTELTQLRSGGGWRDCKVELPEKFCYDSEPETREGVLVWISYRAPFEDGGSSGWVRQAKLNWNGLWVELDEETLVESAQGMVVTHWQPLPAPPTEGAGEMKP